MDQDPLVIPRGLQHAELPACASGVMFRRNEKSSERTLRHGHGANPRNLDSAVLYLLPYCEDYEFINRIFGQSRDVRPG
jgi:hypothetical protein